MGASLLALAKSIYYGITRSWETTTSVKMADTSYDIIGQVRVKTKRFCNKNACDVGQNCLHYGVY